MQVAESKPNINLEIVSHLPFEFAILNLDRENHHEARLAKRAFCFWGEFHGTLDGQGMKKSLEKTEKPKPRSVAATAVALQPMDMQTLRGHITNVVCADAVAMVNATIDEVHGGHYQAMKYLFEMIGLFPATVVPDVPQEDSLAGMLLSRLGIQDETADEEGPANHVK